MKKILASAFFVLAIFTVSCSQTPTTGTDTTKSVFGPSIQFADTEHDFGTIEEGGNGTYEFNFTNTGTEPLVLNNVRSSCGCTVPEWPKDPVKPGETSKITVKYDTKRIGNFTKTINVYSNAGSTPIMLRIKGQVVTKPADAAAAQ